MVDTYVLYLQNTIFQYILTRLVLEMCLEMEWRLVEKLARRWW